MWDSVIYDYIGYETLPMNKEEWDFYSAQSEKLQVHYPVDKDKLKITGFSDWAKESLDLAETLVYPDFVEG